MLIRPFLFDAAFGRSPRATFSRWEKDSHHKWLKPVPPLERWGILFYTTAAQNHDERFTAIACVADGCRDSSRPGFRLEPDRSAFSSNPAGEQQTQCVRIDR